jgi:hypothetical protein
MLSLMLNYPAKKATVHLNPTCKMIQAHHVKGQRILLITKENLQREYFRCANKEYRFAAEAHLNDMWILINLGSEQAEIEAAKVFKKELGVHYKRIREAELKFHDCK